MELRTIEGGAHAVVLAGVCTGLVSDAKAVHALVTELSPDAVGLGLEPWLVEHLDELGDAEGPASLEDEAYQKGLAAWGEAHLPGDVLPAAIEAARACGAAVHGVDLDELTYMDRYTAEVGVIDLMRRGLRVRRFLRRPPKADAPEEFCRLFDAKLNRGGFANLEHAREEAMASGLEALAAEGSVVGVVEVQRLDGVTQALVARLGATARVRRR